MGFGLFLMDGATKDGREININKLDARKRINLGKIDKILKVCVLYSLEWYNGLVRETI
jgi:hypothetical protein